VLAGVGLITRRLEGDDRGEKNMCFARRCTRSDLLRFEGKSAATFDTKLEQLRVRHTGLAFASSSESI
jgi:hypothetical protein